MGATFQNLHYGAFPRRTSETEMTRIRGTGDCCETVVEITYDFTIMHIVRTYLLIHPLHFLTVLYISRLQRTAYLHIDFATLWCDDQFRRFS
jgi:hypothetical protein